MIKNTDGNLFSELSRSKRGSLFFIAGPCVIETQDILFEVAEELVRVSEKTGAKFIFKASYTKANRSSVSSYTGPGIEKGLKMLEKVRKEFKFPILTDIHTAEEALIAGEKVDIIQIPAFLCRQTDLLIAAGRTGRIVNIKKGQFASAKEMRLAAEKVLSTGNKNIILTERGTTFGYNNLVVDFRNFMDMKSFGFPVVYDVTHSLQRPAAEGNVSGGQPEYALNMACAASATGCIDGIFFETHPDPEKALSDSKSMLPTCMIGEIVKKTLKIAGMR
jgi:2-dehydro-3-deoxyphosphooctonate aldolase (KDO 8-P synthase)